MKTSLGFSLVAVALTLAACADEGASPADTSSTSVGSSVSDSETPAVDLGGEQGEEEGFVFGVDPFGSNDLEIPSESEILQMAKDAIGGTGRTATFLPPSATGESFRYFWRMDAFVAVAKDLTIIEGSGSETVAGARQSSASDFVCATVEGGGAAQMNCSSETTILRLFVPEGAGAEKRLNEVRDAMLDKRIEIGSVGPTSVSTGVAFDPVAAVAGEGELGENPLGTAATEFKSATEAFSEAGVRLANAGATGVGYDPSAIGSFRYYLGSISMAAVSEQLLVVETVGELTSLYAEQIISDGEASYPDVRVLLDPAAFKGAVCVSFVGPERIGLSCGAGGDTVTIISADPSVSLESLMATLLNATVALGQ